MSSPSTPSSLRSISPVHASSPVRIVSGSPSPSPSPSALPMPAPSSSSLSSRSTSPVRESSRSPSLPALPMRATPSSLSSSPSSSRSTSPVRTPSSSPRLASTSPVRTSRPPSRSAPASLFRASSNSPSPKRMSSSPHSHLSSTPLVRALSSSALRSRSASPVRTYSRPPSHLTSTSLVRASSSPSRVALPSGSGSGSGSTSPTRTPSSSGSFSPPHLTLRVPSPQLSLPPPLLPYPSSGPSSNDSRTPISQAPTLAANSPLISGPDHKKPFKHKLSAARQEWQWQKDEEGSRNAAIDQLMGLVGLEEVKEQVLAIKAKVEICRHQGVDLKGERFNTVFQGNPGTGKTTVARIYAEFLKSSGVLQSSTLRETSGAKLAFEGPLGVGQEIQTILAAGGGVLFVDEAYQLTAPHAAAGGRQALDIILTEMENHIGKLVVIFAGYNKEMQSFFEHNPGLASRVPYTMQFADFEDVELWDILRDCIYKKYDGKMKIEGGMDGLYMHVSIRRLARSRGIRGFGNARSVNNLLAKISERQAKRLTRQRKDVRNQDYFEFTKEDLIGPDPSVAFKSAAWTKLQELTGLEEVKKSARSMIDMLITNYNRELDEDRPLDFSLNRVFFGSPGTGKTTVAKLYGQILADLGLLSDGEVIIKNPSDFIGECLGKSEAKTRAILAATIGKVLIIDEAYMLNTGGTGNQHDTYKTAVIDTLVAEVQGVPGDDRCILILGYEDKLKEMFHNVNPGLSRRFAIDDPFRFQDFDVPQLEEILKLKMKEQDLDASGKALDVALEVLGRARMRPNFSNGGEVDNLLAKAKLNYQTRQSKKDVADRDFNGVFRPEDFDPEFKRNANAIANCRELLKGRVGKEIICTLEGYLERALKAKEYGLDPRGEVPTNFVFKGPPGTGKTTTAQNMGRVYYDMGFLSTHEVVECSASDLIGQFVGHTGPKTKTQLDKALGKVLFVDEAYRLTEGQYATEAVTELVYLLTTERYAGKMVIILAGYTQDMNKLMSSRPALSGLFPEEIVFHTIKPEDCLALLRRELEQKKISAPFLEETSASSDYRKLLRLMKMLSVFPSWSNARDIKTLAKDMSGAVFGGKAATNASGPTLSGEQALKCARKMIAMQFERSGQDGQRVKLPHLAVGDSQEQCAKAPLIVAENAQATSQPPAIAQGPAIAHDEAPCCDSYTKPAGAPVPITPQRAGSAAGVFGQTRASPQPPPPVCLRPQQIAHVTQQAGASRTIQAQPQAEKQATKDAIDAAEADLKRLQQKIEALKASEITQKERIKDADKAIQQHDLDRDELKNRAENVRLEAEKLQQEREAEERELERKRNEHKEQEKKEKEKMAERKARDMGVCCEGYRWAKIEGGYQCEGGSDFMTDAEVTRE